MNKAGFKNFTLYDCCQIRRRHWHGIYKAEACMTRTLEGVKSGVF